MSCCLSSPSQVAVVEKIANPRNEKLKATTKGATNSTIGSSRRATGPVRGGIAARPRTSDWLKAMVRLGSGKKGESVIALDARNGSRAHLHQKLLLSGNKLYPLWREQLK